MKPLVLSPFFFLVAASWKRKPCHTGHFFDWAWAVKHVRETEGCGRYSTVHEMALAGPREEVGLSVETVET